jgi:hypothetical protein
MDGVSHNVDGLCECFVFTSQYYPSGISWHFSAFGAELSRNLLTAKRFSYT